jgi:hypothetical protein
MKQLTNEKAIKRLLAEAEAEGQDTQWILSVLESVVAFELSPPTPLWRLGSASGGLQGSAWSNSPQGLPTEILLGKGPRSGPVQDDDLLVATHALQRLYAALQTLRRDSELREKDQALQDGRAASSIIQAILEDWLDELEFAAQAL